MKLQPRLLSSGTSDLVLCLISWSTQLLDGRRAAHIVLNWAWLGGMAEGMSVSPLCSVSYTPLGLLPNILRFNPQSPFKAVILY